MKVRRGFRLLLEMIFLAALAAGLAFTRLHPAAIVGVMLLGWVLTALIEWAALRGGPHYGSGLPPRYYVPRLELPPPHPIEQRAVGYPSQSRDEAPTWIATAAMRAEAFGEWPVPAAGRAEAAGVTEGDPWLTVELPVVPVPAPEARESVERAAAPVDVGAGAGGQTAPVPPAPVGVPTAMHTLDPFAGSRPGRFRRRGEPPLQVEVAARPGGDRALPGRRPRQD